VRPPVLILLCALPLGGCLVHEVRIEGQAPVDATASPGRNAVLGAVRDGGPAEVRRGPLPFDVPAAWWLRDREGHLLIGHAHALSPLPWWQRFPADLAVDLWPGEVHVLEVATVRPVPVRERSAAEITAEAHAHGYAP
jgi:hypothetical protein